MPRTRVTAARSGPCVELGDYAGFPFSPRSTSRTMHASTRSWSSCATSRRASCRSRTGASQKGDFAVIGFEGRKRWRGHRRAPRRAVPAGHRQRAHGAGLRGRAHRACARTRRRPSRSPSPRTTARRSSPARTVEFTATLRELRERRLPPLDDALRPVRGRLRRPRRSCARTSERRLQRNALDRARHAFADRIIEYAVANATVRSPDLLVEREVDVMIDELKVRLTQQRHRVRGVPQGHRARRGEAARGVARGRRAPGQGAAGAGRRRRQGGRRSSTTDAVECGDRARPAGRTRSDRRLVEYLEHPARPGLRPRHTLRRSQVVEGIIDRWIEAHPAFADVRHVEDQLEQTSDHLDAAAESVEPDRRWTRTRSGSRPS